VSEARRFLRELLSFGRGRFWAAAALIVLIVAIEAASLAALMEVVRQIGLELRPAAAWTGLLSFTAALAAYVAAVAVRSAAQRAHARLSDHLQAGFTARLRTRLYRALGDADWLFHTRLRVADSVHALTSEADRAGAAAYYVQQLLAGLAIGAVYLALAWWLSPALTAAVVALALLLAIAMRPQAARALATGAATSESAADLHRTIAEHFAAMKIAKAHGGEAMHADAFVSISRAVERASAAETRASTSVRQQLEVGSAVLLAILLFVSHRILRMPPGEMLLLLFAFARLVPRLSDAVVHVTAYLTLLPSYSRVVALERAALAAGEPRGDTSAHPSFTRQIQLAGVTFRYPGAARLAVVDADMTIRHGETVSLTGPSGGGKTTLVDLVIGLLRPDEGRISLDGVALDAAGARAWRRRIGYVAQDSFLFHDTIRANLKWASPDASDERMWAALATAALDRAVRSWPQGLDTVVGDRGVRLSGGERQRLALARAVLRDAALLVLDEPTSALDADHEAQLLDALSALHGKMTILIVSHREAAIRRADRRYSIDAGRLSEIPLRP
jgi:ATP-binding cassette subfamily C protein